MVDPRFLRPGNLRFAMDHVAEEAGEMLAALGKSMRWGLDSVNPLLPPEEQETNRAWLEREILDLRDALTRLEREMTRDRDRSGEADETLQAARPEARARAEGIAQTPSGDPS